MLVFSEKFRLTQADLYANKTVRLSSVLDFFQTVSSEHSDLLGVGFDEMAKSNIAWVLARIKFTVLGELCANELVSVETFPRPRGAATYERDYFIYGENGDVKVKGSSQWVLMDGITRRLIRPFFDYEGEFVDRRAYTEKLERIMPICDKPLFSYTINDNDVDRNGHVNNIKYADFMTAALFPQNAHTVIINFVSELKRGDTIDVTARQADGGIIYTGRCGDTVKFTGRIETR